jgi:hypothetical protein
LDLSGGAIGDDDVCAAFGDVLCFFYCLRGDSHLSQWLWLSGVDFNVFREACIREGANLADFAGCDGVGFCGLPMGFSWAPYLAERCLEHLLSAAGYEAQGRILHNEDAPALERDAPLSMPYLDDFLGIRRGESAAENEESCKADLGRMRKTLDENGLGCHKEGVGRFVQSLGIDLNLNKGERRAMPKKEKFSTLLMATRAATKATYLSPRQLSVIVGHWAWWLMLQPSLFCVLDEVYEFIGRWERACGAPQTRNVRKLVPDSVRAELRLLLRLAPFVRVDLEAAVDGRVYMTDACEVSGAACYADRDVNEVRRLIQTSASWGGAVEPPAREFCDPVGWKVAARAQWRRDGVIDALEGEALMLGVRHAVRHRSRRRKRVLFYVDNQALLGSVRKGRSSARRLLHVCRRVTSHALFAEVRLHFRYVPSDLNVADYPSRGLPNAGCKAWQPTPSDERTHNEHKCRGAAARHELTRELAELGHELTDLLAPRNDQRSRCMLPHAPREPDPVRRLAGTLHTIADELNAPRRERLHDADVCREPQDEAADDLKHSLRRLRSHRKYMSGEAPGFRKCPGRACGGGILMARSRTLCILCVWRKRKRALERGVLPPRCALPGSLCDLEPDYHPERMSRAQRVELGKLFAAKLPIILQCDCYSCWW